MKIENRSATICSHSGFLFLSCELVEYINVAMRLKQLLSEVMLDGHLVWLRKIATGPFN